MSTSARIPPITKENARQMQALSAQSRKLQTATRKSVVVSATHELDYAEFTMTLTRGTQGILLRLVLMINNAKHGETIAELSSAMERLFKIWAHLTQTPAPGQLRPEKMKKLLREYGMKSAIANAMSQAPDPTPNATPIPSPEVAQNNGGLSPHVSMPESPITNTDGISGLTPLEAPPITNQQPPELHTPSEETDQSILKHSFSQAGPVPTPDTPDTANGSAME